MGNIMGRRVGWEQCWGIGTVWKGAKVSRRERYLALAGQCPCFPLSSLSWMGPGKSSSPPFLEWHQLLQPPHLLLPFFSSLLHRNFQQHPNLVPNSLAWKGERRRLRSPLLFAGRSSFQLWSLSLFRGPLPVSWGLSPSTPFERLTLLRTT